MRLGWTSARLVMVLAVGLIAGISAEAAKADDDPLQSPGWAALAAKSFGSVPFVYDERVKVVVPSVVENQAQVPVTVDARAVGRVSELMVMADLSPIQHVLTLRVSKAEPYLSFRLKVEQGTPVRAAALAADGVWHVGSVFLDAAGGGCTAAAMARKDADWTDTVGQVQGRMWRELDGGARLRLRVRHPMDTGLAKDGTPAFFIEHVDVRDASGGGLATLELFEPVGEDPTVTLLLGAAALEAGAAVTVDGRDNNGGIFRSRLTAPLKGLPEPAVR